MSLWEDIKKFLKDLLSEDSNQSYIDDEEDEDWPFNKQKDEDYEDEEDNTETVLEPYVYIDSRTGDIVVDEDHPVEVTYCKDENGNLYPCD